MTYTAHEIIGGAAVRQCGRDWIDATATGDVVYAGGATV